jgi:hypothetical protein
MLIIATSILRILHRGTSLKLYINGEVCNMMHQIRSLAAATVMQAVQDYFQAPNEQKQILRDLRSEWMQYLSNGISLTVAEQLERNPKQIRARLRKFKEGIV